MSHNSSQPEINTIRHANGTATTSLAVTFHTGSPEIATEVINAFLAQVGTANVVAQPDQRQFEVRGSITIDYAMGFSESEARDWFPDARWDDPDASHAGNIETECLDSAPKEFWDCVRIKREVVVDMDVKVREGDGSWKIRDEVTGVVEL